MIKVIHQNLRLPSLAIFVACCLGVVTPLIAAIPATQRIVFEVLRDGAPLGHHTVVFRRDGGDLHVEIDIALEVKLAFVTLYRYRHSNHETWRGERLIAIETRTDDDGTDYWLRGRAEATGFRVEGSSGSFLAPGDIMPTSYWNSQTVNRSQLLDSQKGRLIEVTTASAGAESLQMPGRRVAARRYSMDGDLDLDLWYTDQGEWAKISFHAGGADVVYLRQRGPETPAQAKGAETVGFERGQ